MSKTMKKRYGKRYIRSYLINIKNNNMGKDYMDLIYALRFPVFKPITFLATVSNICQNCYIFAPILQNTHYDHSRSDIKLCVHTEATIP